MKVTGGKKKRHRLTEPGAHAPWERRPLPKTKKKKKKNQPGKQKQGEKKRKNKAEKKRMKEERQPLDVSNVPLPLPSLTSCPRLLPTWGEEAPPTPPLTQRVCVCVSAVVKRGPALLEVVTSPCDRSIHPRIKAGRALTHASEHLCVFVGNGADFRAPGTPALQRSSSPLPPLHIYSIGGRRRPRWARSAAAINSLEACPSPAAFKEP